MDKYEKQLPAAIKQFWNMHEIQSKPPVYFVKGKKVDPPPAYSRAAPLDVFREILREVLQDAGVPADCIFYKERKELPGYYRAERIWDLICVVNGKVICGLEIASQLGPSFGNNFNGRIEAAIGNATDVWTAFDKGIYKPSPRPWLGYLFLMEDGPAAKSPVRVKKPHFHVYPDFKDASYSKRYEIFFQRLVTEKLYNACCFGLTLKSAAAQGKVTFPTEELGFRNFCTKLQEHAAAFMKANKS